MIEMRYLASPDTTQLQYRRVFRLFFFVWHCKWVDVLFTRAGEPSTQVEPT